MELKNGLTWSALPYGFSDFKPVAQSRYSRGDGGSSVRGDTIQCCIKNCKVWLPMRHKGVKATFCSEHGISISTKPTYVFQEKARNIIVGKALFDRVSANKVESWRLGYETSEDALTWNVFVGLFAFGGLREAFEKLTTLSCSEEPELYLWGNRIGADGAKWDRLLSVRKELEKGLSIPTEPDIILRIPGKAIVLIEAKFGSANGTLARKEERFGSVSDFLNRYTPRKGTVDPLNRKVISGLPCSHILEQLCRNAVFANQLSSGSEKAVVVNLVRDAAENCEVRFREQLTPNSLSFHRRTWEELFSLPVIKCEAASHLRRYVKNKSLNLAKAFDL